MEFDFDLPETVDETREIEVRKDGKCWGVFDVKHQFVGSPEWLIDYKRHTAKLSRRERDRIDDPQTAEDIQLRREILISFFVDKFVTNSKAIPLKTGEWKHSKNALVAYLSSPAVMFVYEELSDFSSDAANYRAAE
ncbi:hypothetical protein, partial [Sphingomonas sp. Ag1]|uniref:hypothetical protein n=1 Tax=Sphingomonas sp. Ag1 TaxID=1642949 RepID=UPI00062217D9